MSDTPKAASDGKSTGASPAETPDQVRARNQARVSRNVSLMVQAIRNHTSDAELLAAKKKNKA